MASPMKAFVFEFEHGKVAQRGCQGGQVLGAIVLLEGELEWINTQGPDLETGLLDDSSSSS